MITDFFVLLGAQPLDVRISAGLIVFSYGLLFLGLLYPLVIEAYQLMRGAK